MKNVIRSLQKLCFLAATQAPARNTVLWKLTDIIVATINKFLSARRTMWRISLETRCWRRAPAHDTAQLHREKPNFPPLEYFFLLFSVTTMTTVLRNTRDVRRVVLGQQGWVDPATPAVSFETMEARRPDNGQHEEVLRPLYQHGTCT